MKNQSVANDISINVLDNNELLTWIKKWNIYPYQFMEAYHAVKEKSVSKIEEYLREKGFISSTVI
ncbi:MAG: hypothetical protein ABIN89_06835 [Chitinophagaceae bacterium]